jgi:signal transduction histidine kinase
MLALAGVDSVAIGRKRFTIVGGVDVESRFLRRLSGDGQMSVSLATPDDSSSTRALAGDDGIVRELPVPFADAPHQSLDMARFRITHSLDELRAVRARIDRWFVVVVAAAVLLAVLLSGWVASRVSRPIADLADRAARVDLDRLDVDFTTGRTDEVGVLARGLGAMTERLRESATRLREAERRAVTGDLARQVTHDIKNGLTPIRHTFRHLEDELDSRPSGLAGVFGARRAALDASISYLESLAANYGRIARHGARQRTDLNQVVRRAADHRRVAANARVTVDLCESADVFADPLSLQRIVENLLDNAVDCLDGRGGDITLATRIVDENGSARVRFSVRDSGPGISEARRARIFEDFYTTKPEGTGLGLSIVRRLVMDLDGTIHVESVEGAGSCFIVDMPPAGTPGRGGGG